MKTTTLNYCDFLENKYSTILSCDDYSAILRIINLTNKNLSNIKKFIQIEDQRIETIEYFHEKGNAVITFADEVKIWFKNYRPDNEEIVNRVMSELNQRVLKGREMLERRIVSYKNYGFTDYIEPTEYKNTEELHDFYFMSGELLSILYVLNCTNLTKENIIEAGKYPVLENLNELFRLNDSLTHGFKAVDIAQIVLKYSVYNLEFLPANMQVPAKVYREKIKAGFEYMYNIILKNKKDFIEFVKKIFVHKACVGSIMSKIYGISEGDLQRQLYFIDVRFLEVYIERTSMAFSVEERPSEIYREELVMLAGRFGDHLVQKGIIGYTDSSISRTWITVSKAGESSGKEVLSAEAYDLYDGNSGIALFLLYLGVISKKEYFIKVAIESMDDCMRPMEALSMEGMISSDMFGEVLGQVYVLYKIYLVTGNNRVKNALDNKISWILKILEQQDSIETIEENAGLLGLLISEYETAFNGYLKEKLLAMANMIYAHIRSNLECNYVRKKLNYKFNVIIALMAELMKIKGDPQIRDTIKQLLQLERKINLRQKAQVNESCCGNNTATLISRLMLQKAGYMDNKINEEIYEAMKFLIKNGFGRSPYYSTGDIGSLEVLEYAAEVLQQKKLGNRCINTFNSLVDSVIAPNIEKEIKFGKSNVSLWNGVTGLAYSLIKTCNKELVPRLVWLQF